MARKKIAFKMNTSLLYTYATEFPKMFFDMWPNRTLLSGDGRAWVVGMYVMYFY